MVLSESAARAAAAVPLPICRHFQSLHARQCHCCVSCMSLCCRCRFSYQLLAPIQACCAQHVADDVCKLAQLLYPVLLPSSATLTDRVASPKAHKCRLVGFVCSAAGPGASPTMLYSLRRVLTVVREPFLLTLMCASPPTLTGLASARQSVLCVLHPMRCTYYAAACALPVCPVLGDRSICEVFHL